MIWFNMLNALKKTVMMTMLAKLQGTSLKVIDDPGRDKNSHF